MKNDNFNFTNSDSPEVSGRTLSELLEKNSMKSYKPIPLEKGNYYHIYNRGNNNIDVFFDADSYYHFLNLYYKYISPIAVTYAWCLLKNHFHILVYIGMDHEIEFDKLEYFTIEKPKVIEPSK